MFCNSEKILFASAIWFWWCLVYTAKHKIGFNLYPTTQIAIYLQSQPNSLGDGSFRENGLHVRHQFSGQPPAFWTDEVTFLLNAGDHGEVKGKVGGNDPADSLLLQFLLALQVYSKGQTDKSSGFRTSCWCDGFLNRSASSVTVTFITDLHPCRLKLFPELRRHSDYDAPSRLSRFHCEVRPTLDLLDPVRQSEEFPQSRVCESKTKQHENPWLYKDDVTIKHI